MQTKGVVGLVVLAIVAVLGLSAVLGSFYTVDDGERGVVLRNGKYIGTAEPGLNWKAPFIDDVQTVSIRTFTVPYAGLQAYSKDQQTATIRTSVTFSIPAGSVGELYSKYGSVDNLVARELNRSIPEQVEIIFGKYNAITAVQKRDVLSADVAKAIKGAVKGPLLIEGVKVENIDFSGAYETSIEDRMKAEVKVETEKQNLAKELVLAEITVAKAQALADSTLAQAKADAESITLRGDAEANAIKAKAAALRDNQNLVELTKAERWDGKLPTTMLPNGAVPFLQK